MKPAEQSLVLSQSSDDYVPASPDVRSQSSRLEPGGERLSEEFRELTPVDASVTPSEHWEDHYGEQGGEELSQEEAYTAERVKDVEQDVAVIQSSEGRSASSPIEKNPWA